MKLHFVGTPPSMLQNSAAQPPKSTCCQPKRAPQPAEPRRKPNAAIVLKVVVGGPVSHTLPLGKKWGLVSATPSFLVVPCHRRWRQSLQWSMSSSSGKMSSSYISGRRRRRHKHWIQHLRQNYFSEWFWMTNTHFIARANESTSGPISSQLHQLHQFGREKRE